MRRLAPIIALVLIAAPALAEGGEGGEKGEKAETPRRSYVGVEGGMTVMNEFDPHIPGVDKSGFEVGGAALIRAGRQWRDHIRFDGEVGWQGAKVGSLTGRLDIAYATANAYYDFADPGSRVRPYLGAGLGVAGGWLQSDDPNAVGPRARQSGVGFAYIIQGGARFPLNDSLSMSAAWHFLGTVALIESVSGDSIDPTMHAFMVGLHQAF
jgi:opacity protein-like surface antigen